MKRTEWSVRMEQVRTFIETYHRKPRHSGSNEERTLANWIGVQMQKYHTGRLSSAQILQCEQAGVSFSVYSTEENWHFRYKQYVLFVKEHGRQPAVNKHNALERQLQTWASYQRKSCVYRTAQQKEMLLGAGIITKELLKKREHGLSKIDVPRLPCETGITEVVALRIEQFIAHLAEKISISEAKCMLCADSTMCERNVYSGCYDGVKRWLLAQKAECRCCTTDTDMSAGKASVKGINP